MITIVQAYETKKHEAVGWVHDHATTDKVRGMSEVYVDDKSPCLRVHPIWTCENASTDVDMAVGIGICLWQRNNNGKLKFSAKLTYHTLPLM